MKHILLRSLCVLVFGAAGLAASASPETIGYFEQIKNDPPPAPGGEYYLRHCIMCERGVHVATNYWRGTLVPINSKVVLVALTEGKMVIRVEGTGQEVKVKNVPEYTHCDLAAIAARMLSPAPIPIGKFDGAIADAIKSGTLRLGMTKEQVVMARGYPPAHHTPSLDMDRWQYWSSRFVIQTIVFTNGVLTAGRGID